MPLPPLARLIPVLAILSAWTSPGVAQQAGFTAAQRAEIVGIVRDAMRQDPSILRDAILSLQADEKRREAADQGSQIATHRAALLDATGDAIAGNPHGDVTVVEFYDPRCPYCKRMIPTIADAVAADPKLRVVFKVIPILGPASLLEARAIVAAGEQGRYIPMQEALMGEAAPATEQSIASAASALKLDPAELAHAMNDATVNARLDANLALARALHVDGTPALVIGDALISGALSLPDLQRAIASART